MIHIDHILWPAAITRHVVTATIPRGLLQKCRIARNVKYEHVCEDTKINPGLVTEACAVDSAVMKFWVSEKHLYEPTSDSREEV